MSPPSHLTTLDYLAEVAREWVIGEFAAAEDRGFVLTAHRFELDGATVRRASIPAGSAEADNPFQFGGDFRGAVAWARGDTVTLRADRCTESVAFQQEIVEILAVEGDQILAEAACVARIGDLPPCLGSFFSAT